MPSKHPTILACSPLSPSQGTCGLGLYLANMAQGKWGRRLLLASLAWGIEGMGFWAPMSSQSRWKMGQSSSKLDDLNSRVRLLPPTSNAHFNVSLFCSLYLGGGSLCGTPFPSFYPLYLCRNIKQWPYPLKFLGYFSSKLPQNNPYSKQGGFCKLGVSFSTSNHKIL